MLKLLVMAPKYPYPPDDGHTVRNYHLLRNLPIDCCFDFVDSGSTDLLRNSGRLREQSGPSCIKVLLAGSDTLRKAEYGERNFVSELKNIWFPAELGFGVHLHSVEMANLFNERIGSDQ